MRRYPTIKELTKKKFTINGQNINQENHIHVIVMKVRFLAKYDHFLATNVSFFEPLLRWEYAHVCHNLRTQKEGICSKKSGYKSSN